MPFRLADAIFWVAVVCCCIAQLAILRSIVATPNLVEMPDHRRGRRVAEIAWAVIPAVALAAVLFFTWRAMHPSVVAAGRAPTTVAAR
jgi:heme/copper-type cytochrome/quinol oxidase subunit 2